MSGDGFILKPTIWRHKWDCPCIEWCGPDGWYTYLKADFWSRKKPWAQERKCMRNDSYVVGNCPFCADDNMDNGEVEFSECFYEERVDNQVIRGELRYTCDSCYTTFSVDSHEDGQRVEDEITRLQEILKIKRVTRTNEEPE